MSSTAISISETALSARKANAKVHSIILGTAGAGAGIAAATPPGADVLALRICEVLLVSYIAFLYQIPLRRALVKGCGVSGFATVLGTALADAATLASGGIAAPVRSAVAFSLISSIGFLAKKAFEKEGSLSAKLLDVLTVTGLLYDLRALISLASVKLRPARTATPPAFRGEPVSPYDPGKCSPVFRELAEMKAPESGPASPLLRQILDVRSIQENAPQPFDLPDAPGACVYGQPDALRQVVDYVQDDNIHHVTGSCGINAAVNALHRIGIHTTDDHAAGVCLEHGWCGMDTGTTWKDQLDLVRSLGGGDVEACYKRGKKLFSPFSRKGSVRYSPADIGQAVRSGAQAILHIDSAFLNGLSEAPDCADHAVCVSGAVFDKNGMFRGLTVIDSGVEQFKRFLSTDMLDRIYSQADGSGCILIRKAG